MPKDYCPILYHRESIEPHPHSEVTFTIILVSILLVQLNRGCMDHNKLSTVHLKFNIEGQVIQIFKYLLPDSFLCASGNRELPDRRFYTTMPAYGNSDSRATPRFQVVGNRGH